MVVAIKQQQHCKHLSKPQSWSFKMRCTDMSSSESILCKTRQWLACCLFLSVSLSIWSVCVWVCFQVLRYHRTEKRRTGRTDADGVWWNHCGTPRLCKGSLDELYCVGQLAANSSVSPRCKGLTAHHNNEHLCREALLSLDITVNDRRG